MMDTRSRMTGQMRYRVQPRWFNDPLVVLQVEVDVDDGPTDSNGMPMWLAGTFWRDAKPEDLQFLPKASA